MIEDDDVARFSRHARALGKKINDAAALGQARLILREFEDAYHDAVDRLNHIDGVSWDELGAGAGVSGQTMHRAQIRWRARRARARTRGASTVG